MDRLHGGGKNVLHEFARVLGQMLAVHDLILPKVKLVPAFLPLVQSREYNRIEIERFGREPMAL